MRTLILTGLALVAGILLIVFSDMSFGPQPPAYEVDASVLPAVSARAWGVYDLETGAQLLAHEPDTALPIASLTKLMTAVVAREGESAATTTLSWRAVATEGRAGRLRAGETLSVYELLFPLLIESSNDAAEALAEYTGRDSFIAEMNLAAARLGMFDTVYADPSGLSSENVSTVSDLVRLLRAVAIREPHLLDITRLSQYVGTEHTWVNVNPVSSVDAFRGGKHGYTDEANRTFVGLFEHEFSGGVVRTLTIVLLGSEHLPTDVATLRAFVDASVRYE